MGKLWTVIRREYRERVLTKWFVFVTLFGPLFFAVIMILPGLLSVREMRTTTVASGRIVDATGAGLGERVAQKLGGERVEVVTVPPEAVATLEDSLLRDVIARKFTGYLVLDSATMAGRLARYAGRNAGSVGQMERLEDAVRSALLESRMDAAGIGPETAAALTRVRVNLAAERVTNDGKGGSGIISAIFGIVIAVMLYMSIMLYGQAILRGVLEEKTTRVAEVVMSSVSADTLLAGKVIGVGAVGLTQYAVWALSGFGIWAVRDRILSAMGAGELPAVSLPSIDPFALVALLLFFLLGYTLYASLFAAVGAMVGSQEEANQAAQPVVMLLILSIIFVQPVATNPTGGMAQVMSLLPFSAPVIMPARMAGSQVSTLEIVGSLLGVALACAVCIWLAARIYRIGLLMYGKRPSLRELGRWVRQA